MPFQVGKELQKAKVGKVFFGGFKDSKRAIPIYKVIAKHAPRWKHSSEALFLVGEILEGGLKYEEAIDAYNERVESRGTFSDEWRRF